MKIKLEDLQDPDQDREAPLEEVIDLREKNHKTTSNLFFINQICDICDKL